MSPAAVVALAGLVWAGCCVAYSVALVRAARVIR